ncbi:MAG: pilus assembly protein PilM [Sedimentisphaerales bacterium]|jgi:Tfp pilus assembly protein PilN
MRFVEKTVAGIDISQESISIVLLKNGKNGPKFVKSAVAPMPAGAVKDGNIVNAAMLQRTLREMKFRNRIWTNRAAVSLFAKPVVTQMIEMPKQMPPNLTQFVHGEMKHCAAMPSGDIVLDYCSVGSNKRSADKKVLAAAAETKKVTELVQILGRAGFSAELVEPAILSYLRAISDKKITGRSGCNVLVAIFRDNILTLCVLRNGVVDFIRTKEVRQKATAGDLCGWLADELAEIQKFYSVEVMDNTGKWEIAVFADIAQLPQDAEAILKSRVQAGSLQVRTSKDAYLDTIVGGQTTGDKNEQPSPVAVGLAMNLLVAQRDDARLNLMPPKIMQIREAKKDVLIAATVVTALLLLMVLVVAAPAYMIKKVSGDTAGKAARVSVRNTNKMLDKNQHLDARLQALSNRLDSIAKISASNKDVNWVQLFTNIRNATPASVRIVSLSCRDGQRVQIEGLALSNDAVNSFVSSLEKSPDISTVTLLESSKQEGQKGFINYQISCKLGVKKGKEDDVG